MHALLSASSAHRWLECTPSAVLESGYADKSSEFALEGTRAHALAERLLLEAHGALVKDAPPLDFEPPAEMVDYCEGYADYVMERLRAAAAEDPLAFLEIETRVDYSDIAPGGFGTADAIIV